jgi:1-phosphofructokinase
LSGAGSSASLSGEMTDEQAIITVTLNPAVDRTVAVDGLRVGAHQPVQTVARVAGGKGVNVSRVLAGLGVPCTATGFLGRENASEFQPIFAGGSIRDAFLKLPGRTRENVTIADTADGTDTHLRDAGLAVRPADVRELGAQLAASIEPGDVVLLCGSLPPGMSAEAFAEMVRLCIDAGGQVGIDTSGEALSTVRRAKAWLLKPNVAELAELIGREVPTLDEQLKAARGIAQRGTAVLLSRGADGACLVTAEGTWCARLEREIEVLNTVGCGDTLLGAFVAAVWMDHPPAEALRQAVATAGATAMTAGTAVFDPAKAERLMGSVAVEEH